MEIAPGLMPDALPTAEELLRFGVPSPWWFAIRHRIRWSECDPFRHANHRAYLEWFESLRANILAREQALRDEAL